ncbi:MAG: hypothetical protein DI622_15650 [Chryseobacterium sp.]|uniref:helix-turn-helix transcriptional regulator n=1 Tax=Chryseobacterium sp. TaxID=1871047 RepID=UPI000DAF5673|nr:helix-turn-helix transcriptional regulator [Chryseobacterium sp.]MPS63974.1 XRE family transcriptional regulator [Chryseobacterium sp.]PZU11340.1 MAG: hypothetical protein DI622_15650 [Chryseobacterium sp.]
MKIGEKLRGYRYRNNYSQQQVAEFLDISQSTYCDWESDKMFPKIDKLLKISKLFNVGINELLTLEKIDNSSNSKNETLETLLKISETLEKLVFLVEKVVETKT